MASINFFDEPESDTDTEAEDDQQVRKRRRGAGISYLKVKSFPDKATAVGHLKEEALWTKRYESNSSEGVKLYYNCKHNRNCSAKIYLLLEADSQVVSLYKTIDSHDHGAVKQVGIAVQTKTRIEELYRTGITQILANLRLEGIEVPKRQLDTFLVQLRKKIIGKCEI
jgi:hypothetical protein